jgi:uncharacterized protein YkwD
MRVRKALVLAGIATALIGAGAPATASAACANTDLQPSASNMPQVRRATICMLNVQRSKRHLGKLHANSALRGVAQRYSRLMVLLHFFDHVAPSGSTFVQRIQQSTYLHGYSGWALGENLAWGGGGLSTPRQIVRAWMNSPEHKANILNGSYRDIGVGIASGVPVLGGGAGATYVNEFGQRTR